MVNSRFKYVILSFFCIKEVKNTLLSCFLMTKWGVLVVFLRFLRTKCSFMSFEVRKLTNYRFFFDGFASGFSSLRSQRLKRSLRSRLIDRSQLDYFTNFIELFIFYKDTTGVLSTFGRITYGSAMSKCKHFAAALTLGVLWFRQGYRSVSCKSRSQTRATR